MATYPSNSDVKANRHSNTGQTVLVTKPADGGQFNSIREGVDHAISLGPTPIAPIVVQISKGDYMAENNPIPVPDNVYIRGDGSRQVRVVPANLGPVFLESGVGGTKELSGLTIDGGEIGITSVSDTEEFLV